MSRLEGADGGKRTEGLSGSEVGGFYQEVKSVLP